MVQLGPAKSSGPNAQGLRHVEWRIENFQIRTSEHVEYLKQKYDADTISVDFEINVVGFFRY